MHKLLPFLILSGCTAAQSSDAPPAPSPYMATAVGRVDSADEARQLVASADGVITRLYVERGQSVSKGQPLLGVDCGPRVAETRARYADAQRAAASSQLVQQGARSEEIAAAAAAVSAAQTVALNQQQRLDQASALIGNGFISKRELDARTNDLNAAKAQVAAANAKLAELTNGSRPAERVEAGAASRAALGQAQTAEALADQCTMRSPVSGQVLQIMRREGEFSGASQGLPLIIVGDLSRLTVRAEVNEHDAARIATGQKAQVWIEGQSKRWSGHVTHMASVMGRRTARSLDPTDRFDRDTREAFISFDDQAPPALVGLRVTVGFTK
jgi:HlyD family secretion protein